MSISILNYNGGGVVAMTGQNCVAIASDTRYGTHGQTISTDKEKMFQVGPQIFLGLTGLVTDAQSVMDIIRFRTNLYKLKEQRPVQPHVLSKMVSNILYEKRFGPYFVEPVIAGLHYNTKKPYICNMDLIGCLNETDDFVVAGTCSSQLYGMCESVWQPNMDSDDLFETIGQVLLNAIDRDSLSGWGAVVYLIEPDRITLRKLKCRMD